MPALLLRLLHYGDVEREGLERQCPPYFYACHHMRGMIK